MSDRPELLNQLIDERFEKSQDSRLRVLEQYTKRKWLDVAEPDQVFRRLNKKGLKPAAEMLFSAISLAEPRRSLEELAKEDTTTGRHLRDVKDVVFEKILGVSDLMPAGFLERGARAARSVGRIVFRAGKQPNGTGFLVSPRLLLTNNHVLPTPSAAQRSLVQFDFEETAEGSIDPVEFRLIPDELFLYDGVQGLDYTLVAVEPQNSNSVELASFGQIPMISELGKVQEGERVNIIQHPKGLPKQLALRQNFLVKVLDRFLHYVTDTQGGSSGAPVFNDEWELIALHHGYRPIRDPKEVVLIREALHPDGSGRTSAVIANEGVRVSKLLDKMKEQGRGLPRPKQTLLEQVFVAHRSGHPAWEVPARAPPTVNIAEGPTVTPDGTVHWSIPLQLKMKLGAGPMSGLPVDLGRSPGASAPNQQGSRLAAELELYNQQLNSYKSVIRGVAYLDQSRQRTYLPTGPEMQEARQDYYGDLIDSVDNGMDPGDLYDELHQITSSQLTLVQSFPEPFDEYESLLNTRLESMGRLALEASNVQYSKARAHLYTWVDLWDHGMLRCVYTDKIMAPERVMLRDMLESMDLEDHFPPGLNTSAMLQCEHVVCQSWFNKQTVPQSDLHHLFSCDGPANNFRSNRPYRQIPQDADLNPSGADDTLMQRAGRRTSDHFEPRQDRRPMVARATLYFLIAHRGLIGSDRYGPNEINILIQWANQQAPDRFEMHRNEAIFEVQGNRNPLIDFPAWVDQIDFGRGLS